MWNCHTIKKVVAELHETVCFSQNTALCCHGEWHLPINERKSRLHGRLYAANTFIHAGPWPQASFISCLTDLADTRRPLLETDGRSGTAGERQMASLHVSRSHAANQLKKEGPK